jgi:iron complex outermembrane receptor protein
MFGPRAALAVPICLLVCISATATTKIPPDTGVLTDVVDTVKVVADRPDPLDEIWELPTFATVHEIGDARSGVISVADVIEEGAGVDVKRYGGLGAYSTASIRASSPAQVEICLDGVPLRSAQWGVMNLSDLPLSNIERIEVYRSGAPVGLGVAGIGGVINLVTRPAGEDLLGCSVSTGSHGTFGADVHGAGRVRSVGYLISFHHLRSEGDFTYVDHHGTPENTDDDAVVTRENNQFEQSGLFLRIAPPPFRGWRFELSDDLFVKESGIPGIENVHIESANFDVFRNVLSGSLESPLLVGNALELRAMGFHHRQRDRFYNPDSEVGLNRSDTDNRSTAAGVNLLGTLHWYRGHQVIRLFSELRYERYVPEDMNPNIGVGFTRKRRVSTLNAEDRVVLWGGSLALVVGYHYQEAVDNYAGPVPFGGPPTALDEPHWSVAHGPSLGLRWSPAPSVVVRANRGRYGRFPTMLELFGANGYVVGNAELRPEEGTTTDVGVVFRMERPGVVSSVLEAAAFLSERDDLITFLQSSPTRVKAFNLESARVAGLELSARCMWERGLELSVSYTREDARNTGPSPIYHDKRIPYVPQDKLFVRTALAVGRITFRYDYHFEGDTYRDRANLPENMSPARHLHGVGARVELTEDLALDAQVQNVFDAAVADVEGYPLPGRTFYVTLKFAVGSS